MTIRFGQVNILVQALVSEIYYISNHWNFISNHCTPLYIWIFLAVIKVLEAQLKRIWKANNVIVVISLPAGQNDC